jgi:hypothetical protein
MQAQARKAWQRAQQGFNERMGPERVARLHAVIDECLGLLNEVGEGEE